MIHPVRKTAGCAGHVPSSGARHSGAASHRRRAHRVLTAPSPPPHLPELPDAPQMVTERAGSSPAGCRSHAARPAPRAHRGRSRGWAAPARRRSGRRLRTDPARTAAHAMPASQALPSPQAPPARTHPVPQGGLRAARSGRQRVAPRRVQALRPVSPHPARAAAPPAASVSPRNRRRHSCRAPRGLQVRRRTTIEPLVPPNPKELEIAASILISRASLAQ